MNADPAKRARSVRCPACGKHAAYSTENPARPFCSVRCRSIDLGAWASESYRVASGASPAEGDGDSPSPGTAPH
jgi:endogenous inhibitor of DNA gyrase (YacG/DUF329 family)